MHLSAVNSYQLLSATQSLVHRCSYVATRLIVIANKMCFYVYFSTAAIGFTSPNFSHPDCGL